MILMYSNEMVGQASICTGDKDCVKHATQTAPPLRDKTETM
jgi:hypothetical protein